jgi:hypothetical protein
VTKQIIYTSKVDDILGGLTSERHHIHIAADEMARLLQNHGRIQHFQSQAASDLASSVPWRTILCERRSEPPAYQSKRPIIAIRKLDSIAQHTPDTQKNRRRRPLSKVFQR